MPCTMSRFTTIARPATHAARPVTIARRPVAARPRHHESFEPTWEELKAAVSDAIVLAKDICRTGSTSECAAAWDIVEELSAAAADAKKRVPADPREGYCADDESADECKMYDV